ncbi:MAG: imidazole glycerol phosphate synthase subunit HisH [Bacteroidales bacterium]|nr:imidazole glycerol phosphate synthase subunit HisH [Candidatus Cacconaster merdequi]
MIAIVDYGVGNLRSVENALKRLDAEYLLTDNPEIIRTASKVILPGVGNVAEAMFKLREKGLVEPIRNRRRPLLGICVGMQVLCRHSEEGDTDCIGLFDTDVTKFSEEPGLKVPHMGWNRINNLSSKLFKNISEGAYVYFVHSYRPQICRDTVATTDYGGLFSCALKYENFYGTQFHPEKSGDVGEEIIRNFLAL